LEAVRAEQWERLESLGPRLAARWTVSDPSTRARIARHRASLLLAKLRETVTRRGVSVALLAPDGAGKSALSESLENALFFSVRRFYLGLEGGPFRNTGKGRVPLGGFFRRLVHVWGTYLRARYHQTRRRCVIFDRYPYEALLPAPAGTGRLSRWRRGILGHALPAPDLVVVLDAPGDVLHRRKAEHTPERLERDRAGYRELARRFRGVVVDAVRTPDEVRREVVDAIWQVYLRRCGAR
jgi:thymidylate kinase